MVLSIPSSNRGIDMKYIGKEKKMRKGCNNIDFALSPCYSLFHMLRVTYSYL